MALLVDIEKRLGSFCLRVKLESEGDVLALLGASGCGKSMTLKCIAGIERPDRGRIVLDGRTLFDSEKRLDLPPQKRRVGYLFQQYALFPHMTVAQNIACGVRNRKAVNGTVSDMISRLHLEGLEGKRPHQLSGGQQQRVALARILANEPEILLLDEPFSALDSHLRFQMERELQQVIARFEKPVVLVSHDRDEVFRLSRRVAIMKDGTVETSGEKHTVFADPITVNGAILTGCKNISAVKQIDATHVFAQDWGVTLQVRDTDRPITHIGIRMQDMTADGRENRLLCRVVDEIENPFSVTVLLRPVEGGGVRGFAMEWDKERWAGMRQEIMEVSLPVDSILLLRG